MKNEDDMSTLLRIGREMNNRDNRIAGHRAGRGILSRLCFFIIAGLFCWLAAECSAGTCYVSPSGSHAFPYASWVSAATNIQPADFDSDGKADPAIYQNTENSWYIWFSGSGYARGGPYQM